MDNLKCDHKKTKMKLTLVGFSKRINPLKWFAMRECCKRCGEVVKDKQ